MNVFPRKVAMIIGLNFLIFTQIVDLIYCKTAVFDHDKRRSLKKKTH